MAGDLKTEKRQWECLREAGSWDCPVCCRQGEKLEKAQLQLRYMCR